MMRLFAAAIVVVLSIGPVTGQSGGQLEPGTFTPSATCGECHEEIYDMWRRSMHSAALSDPIFEVSFMKAYWETRGEAQEVCFRCHAPVAALTGDMELGNPVSREGITCDFCHSVVAVDLSRRGQPFEVANDGVKRGPLADAESPVHGVERSELHESSEFCAGCHEYTDEKGLPLLTTYSEWKASPQAAEGKTCQHCHMPVTPGETVRSDLGVKKRGSINLHNISGMHSQEQVRKSASARILSLKRQGDSVIAEVEVANIGSGHSIPTGLPTRKLVLEVVLFSGSREWRRLKRVYQKTLIDEKGQIITEDHRAMLAADRIGDDNRLRAGERRVERFVAPAPPGRSVRAELRLRYLYEPKLLSSERIAIDIASDEMVGR